MKQFVLLYRLSADYTGLKHNLIELGKADAYIKAIHQPTFTPFHPHVNIVQTSICQLPQGIPMEIDQT